MADDKKPEFVHPNDAAEHGYHGQRPAEKNNDDYTVAGVAGDSDKASNPPSEKAASRVRANTAALKKETAK